jgi:hypothetical protein
MAADPMPDPTDQPIPRRRRRRRSSAAVNWIGDFAGSQLDPVEQFAASMNARYSSAHKSWGNEIIDAE